MYNSKKKPTEDIPTETTVIWACSNENCNGWMRDNFSFYAIPKCPQCHSTMVKADKVLGVLENNSPVTSKKL